MERYSHIQNLPNSPLTPLTPLSENTSFDFNFGGDGSLDMYIENVRHEHRIEQQQKKLLQQANRSHHKPGCPAQPKRYSEEFRKIRDVFESQGYDEHDNCTLTLKEAPTKYCHHQQQMFVEPTSKLPTIKITHTGATPTHKMLTSAQQTPTPKIQTSTQKVADYVTTPTNARNPLKQRNHNILLNIPSKSYAHQQKIQQKIQYHQQHRQQAFRQASPVASKPLCPRVAKILHRCGLSIYSGIFQREEIDLYTFQFLTLHDLHQIGIVNPKHCEVIMADIYYAGQYFNS